MITSQLLAKIFPGTRRSLRDRFVEPLNKYCAEYGINTQKRVAAFLATGGVETDYLRTTTEYASGAAYEGRRDLGNTQKGDGEKFRGHGFFQTTGRANHRRVTEVTFSKLGIDFEKQPERLAEIEVAVESACIYWRDNKLSRYADGGDFFGVSGVVNRGSAKKKALHYDKRLALYNLCLKHIPIGFTIAPEPAPVAPTAIEPANPDPVVLTPTEQPAADENAKLKDFSDKYLKHCKNDSVKNVIAVVGVRATSAVSTVWALGLSGKIALFVIVAAVLGFSIYALVYYRQRIFGWLKTIFDSLLNS